MFFEVIGLVDDIEADGVDKRNRDWVEFEFLPMWLAESPAPGLSTGLILNMTTKDSKHVNTSTNLGKTETTKQLS